MSTEVRKSQEQLPHENPATVLEIVSPTIQLSYQKAYKDATV